MIFSKLGLKTFLLSAVINPSDKKDRLMQEILEHGTSQMYEWKANEAIIEAARIRERMASKRYATALLELYNEKLRSAATFISLAAEFENGQVQSQSKGKTRGKDSEGTEKVSETT